VGGNLAIEMGNPTFSDGKSYCIAIFPEGGMERGKGYYTTAVVINK
jgi:hypothetical protein